MDGSHTTGAFGAQVGGGGAGGAPGGGGPEVAVVDAVVLVDVDVVVGGCEELPDVVADGVGVGVVLVAAWTPASPKASPTPRTAPPTAAAIPALAAVLLRFIVELLTWGVGALALLPAAGLAQTICSYPRADGSG